MRVCTTSTSNGHNETDVHCRKAQADCGGVLANEEALDQVGEHGGCNGDLQGHNAEGMVTF